MADKTLELVEELDDTTENGEGVEEMPWVSPAVIAAQNGRTVDFSMDITDQ